MKLAIRTGLLLTIAACCLAGPAVGHAAPLSVGEEAPDFTLMEFGTQDPVSLYDFEGSILLLDFFAYWCPHCQDAASELEPEIAEYYQQQQGNPAGLPVQLLPISVDNRDPQAVEDFITTYGLGITLQDDTADTFYQYSERGSVPHLAIVSGVRGANSTPWEVLYTAPGYGPGGYENLREIIDSVAPAPHLQAGDANQDLVFNQLDLFQVLRAGKYMTGLSATWGEGDWDGAPGGSPGAPPPGDGRFDNLDVVAALSAGTWLTGPYAGSGDEQQPAAAGGPTAIGYDAATGELWVDAPGSAPLTSVSIESEAGIFTGQPGQNLGGDFDADTDNTIFKAVFGGSFGRLSFGNVAQAGLSEPFVRGDLDVMGSLAGGGSLGEVTLMYVPVPEPSTVALAILGLFLLALCRHRQRG